MKKIFLIILLLLFSNNLFSQGRKYTNNSTTGTSIDTVVFTSQVKSGTDTTTKKVGAVSILIYSYGASTDTLWYWTDRYAFTGDKGILVGKQSVEIQAKNKTIDTLYLKGNATISRNIIAGFNDEIRLNDNRILDALPKIDTTNARLDVIKYAVDELETALNQINNKTGSSVLKGFKTGTVGTAADSIEFSGSSNEVTIDFSLGAGSLDTLYIADNSGFTGAVLKLTGGRNFNWQLLYTSKIYFKASGSSKPYAIAVR